MLLLRDEKSALHSFNFSFHDGNLNFYQPNSSFLFAKQSVPALSSPKVWHIKEE